MTQDLKERIEAQLKATEGHTEGPWHVSDRVGEQVIVRTTSGQGVVTSLNRDESHPDAALIAAAPILRALLAEALPLLARAQEAEAEVVAVREALAAERERANVLAWDNDGHAEWLTEHHQDLLRELPDSETTALLGRLLARWQRTPGQRQYLALSEVKEVQEKAALWDAFMGCARIRVMGSGGLDLNTQAVPANGYAHLYVELWTVYDWAAFKDDAALTAREQTSHARSRAYLELYARTALAQAGGEG